MSFRMRVYIPLQGIVSTPVQDRQWPTIARRINCPSGIDSMPSHGGDSTAGRDGVRDPVCGMTVDPHTTPHRHEHRGRTYYFCSAGCRTKFAADPAKYLAPRQAKAPPPVPEGTIYTCPMHPEIRQVGPGSCPICGMALEPELVTAEAGPNPELADMTRRFWIGLVLDAARSSCWRWAATSLELHMLIGQSCRTGCSSLLATPVVLWAAGRSSCAAGNRSSRAISTCSR